MGWDAVRARLLPFETTTIRLPGGRFKERRRLAAARQFGGGCSPKLPRTRCYAKRCTADPGSRLFGRLRFTMLRPVATHQPSPEGNALMKSAVSILALASLTLASLSLILAPGHAAAAEKPDWAFPVTEKEQPTPRIEGTRLRSPPPGSTLSITRAKADDMFDIPNWYPDMYPAMPKIVQFGNKDTQVRACGSCHLPTGTGHDESAYVAGLPAAYFMRQLTDWKSGDRKFGAIMIVLAKAATEAEIKDAASYFASVKPRPWIRVAETDTVPKSFIGPGNKRLVHPAGGSEPMGNRIIEVPENEEDVVYRDPRSGFVAYVPKGSIAKGEALVTSGGGKTVACGSCHGATLLGMTVPGMGEVPAIAGRHPNYIVRQLWNIQNGDRAGPSAALMRPVVEKLSNDDMLAIAAYVASRMP
jgi:cytochrome c553